MKNVLVLGHTGLVGNAVVRQLLDRYDISVRLNSSTPRHDLRSLSEAFAVVDSSRADVVVMAAGHVGGIKSNMNAQYDYCCQNASMSLNVIHACIQAKVKRLIQLGSVCAYPTHRPSHDNVDAEYAYLSGTMEVTNEGHAAAKRLAHVLAKHAPIETCTVVATNLYGPGDNYDLERCHVVPAIIRKMHEAKVNGSKSCELWGCGMARRDFMFADDLARFIDHLVDMDKVPEIVNAATGSSITIRRLALTIKEVVGFEGAVVFNDDVGDGALSREPCTEIMHETGWSGPQYSLLEGLNATYRHFQQNVAPNLP